MTKVTPRDDQHRAAERQAAAIVKRYGALPSMMALTDSATYPQRINEFNYDHAMLFDRAWLRPCKCGTVPASWSQPLFVTAYRPNLVSCRQCFDQLRKDLAKEPAFASQCDLCSAPAIKLVNGHFKLDRMSPVVWRISAVVVIGTVCKECLSS